MKSISIFSLFQRELIENSLLLKHHVKLLNNFHKRYFITLLPSLCIFFVISSVFYQGLRRCLRGGPTAWVVVMRLILSILYLRSLLAFPLLLRHAHDPGNYHPLSLPLISSLDILQEMKEKQLEDAQGMTMFPQRSCVRIQVSFVSHSVLSNDLLRPSPIMLLGLFLLDIKAYTIEFKFH